jgi:HK97 family phage prohead protease
LWNHDLSNILGRTKSKTLRLSADVTGLRYEIDLPNTTLGRDVGELVARGDVTGSSFAFSVRANGDNVTRTKEGIYVRSINAVDLFDVSPVTVPAYDGTSVQARDEAAAQLEAQKTQADTAANEAELTAQKDMALAMQLATLTQ